MMPRSYPPGFRRKVLDLVVSGRNIAEIAQLLGISDQTICVWRHQRLVDTGQLPGTTSSERSELAAARRRIAEPDPELATQLGGTSFPLSRRAAPSCDAHGRRGAAGVPDRGGDRPWPKAAVPAQQPTTCLVALAEGSGGSAGRMQSKRRTAGQVQARSTCAVMPPPRKLTAQCPPWGTW